MTAFSPRASSSVRFAWLVLARAHQRLGWPGWLGTGLLLAALASGLLAWREQRLADAISVELARLTNEPGPPPAAAEFATQGTRLPESAELPLLLTQIEYAALSQHLAWPQAEFRAHAATQELPASVEVRCTLKGPYLKLRAFVSNVLAEVPGVGMREFGLSRGSADQPDVEAKLALVIFLADDGATGAGAAAGARADAIPKPGDVR